MDHRQFLDVFESQKDAADAFGVKPNDIGHWKLRGIPARRWQVAARIAADRGIDLTAEDLAGLPRIKDAA